MNILEDHNEWEPKEITLDYKVYKDLLSKVADYPTIIKQLTEDKSHVLVKSLESHKDVYALVTVEKFNEYSQRFKY